MVKCVSLPIGMGATGRLLDKQTGDPIGGAIVVAYETALVPQYHGSSRHCSNVTTTTTNEDGKYVLPPWVSHPIFPKLNNIIPFVIAHKSGYKMNGRYHEGPHPRKFSTDDIRSGDDYLIKSDFSVKKRMEYLDYLVWRTGTCRWDEGQKKHLYPLYLELLDEAKNIAETPEDKAILQGICEQVATVSISRSESVSSRDDPFSEGARIQEYLRKNIPECLTIKIDYTEKIRFLAALETHDLKTVRQMLKDGFDVERRYKYYRTPLAIASLAGDIEMVALLLQYSADPNALDQGYKKILQQIISSDSLDQKTSVKLVSILIKGGADPHRGDEWNNTPFLDSVKSGKLDVVSTMLDLGADVSDSDPEYRTYNYRRGPALHYVTNIDMARLLIQAGADISSLGLNKKTPLISAAENRKPEVVVYLKEQGANMDAQDGSGYTALMHAVVNYNNDKMYKNRKHKTKNIIEYLVKEGAKTDIVNDWGKTALDRTTDEEIRSILQNK